MSDDLQKVITDTQEKYRLSPNDAKAQFQSSFKLSIDEP